MKMTVSKIVFFPLLLIGLQALATEKGINCQLKDFASCTDCEKRVPVSCEDHKFNGSLELSLKPQKIQWLLSNPKSGVDRVVVTDNFGMDLKTLKAQKDYAMLLKTQKVTVRNSEKVFLTGVQMALETALYKAQQGSVIIAKMTANPQRNIASEAPAYQIGGIRRAQKIQSKESQ